MKALITTTLILSLGLFFQSFTTNDDVSPAVESPIFYQDCDASNNLNITCKVFISRCRRGSINREFPSEFFDEKVGVVKNGKTAAHKKAWKLLNDNRFKK